MERSGLGFETVWWTSVCVYVGEGALLFQPLPYVPSYLVRVRAGESCQVPVCFCLALVGSLVSQGRGGHGNRGEWPQKSVHSFTASLFLALLTLGWEALSSSMAVASVET